MALPKGWGGGLPTATGRRLVITSRRGTGEGSVYKNADGLWCAAVELGRTPDGRRRRRVVKARTKAAVLTKAAEARTQAPDQRVRISAGRALVDQRRTVAEYLDWWLTDVIDTRVAAGDLKPGSSSRYHQVVRLYLKPAIGTVPLAQLGPSDVHRLLRNLETKGLSPATVAQVRTIASGAFKHAERWGLLTRNPVQLVAGPKQPRTRLDDALTAEEAQRLLNVAATDRLGALAVIVVKLGLRKGEALALHWDTIDLSAGTLRVEATRTRVAGWGVLEAATKTVGSSRTIPLPQSVVTALAEHRRRQAAERVMASHLWHDTGHVFTTPLGIPLDPRNVMRWWHKLTEAAGLGKRRMHAGRHTAATLLLDQGVPLEVVSAILGHAGLAITADVYARPTMDAKRRALQTLERPAGS